jgi:TolA-binding protein
LFADIELNESIEDKKAGRTQITMTALTINNRGQWNKRGMTWLEEYVNDNIESIIGAPFVVCFIDENKTIPSGHGTLTYDENGNCQFLDSDTVGAIQKAWIEEIEVDGSTSKKLVVSGYLFNQRYPSFVGWLKDEVTNGTNVKGSVEANGKGESKNIIYEDGGNGKDEEGNWIVGRVPKIFDFTGLAILLPDVVEPADDGSEVIEINSLSKSTDEKSDDIEENNVCKEENNMTDDVKDGVVELHNKIVELNNKINEMNAQLEAKDTEINSLKEKETELNSLLVDANKTIESSKTQIAELNTEIEPLRQMKTDSDKAKAQSEVNTYFETIKVENGFTEVELNSLKTDYVDKCDLDGLKAKEQELCIKKFKEMRKVAVAEAEINSATKEDNAEALFFSTKVETVETNSADDGADLFK